MGPTPSLTVIIPTHKRRAILARCLQALAAQHCPTSAFEVVIVDDGSSDGTNQTVQDFAERAPMRVRYAEQLHKGPAAARNLGIREAHGELALFIGDDIIATPNLLAEHLAWHKQYPEEHVAVLGYVTWSADIEVAPFMHWLENGGPQFKYWSIRDKEDVGYVHFYTSNISLKKRFLLANGLFDEDFPYAAYEDTELGYRLNKRGLRIVYNKQAVGYHHHPTNLDDAMKRMRRVAASRQIFWRKTGLGRAEEKDRRGQMHRALSEAKFWLLRKIGYIAERRWMVPGVYSYLLDKAKCEVRN